MKVKLVGITFNIECPELELISDKLDRVLKKEKEIMATLDELKAKADLALQKVDALNVALDGYRDLVALMKAELDALKSGAQLAPAVQAKVDEISTKLDEGVAAIDATYAENFPPVEPPPDEV